MFAHVVAESRTKLPLTADRLFRLAGRTCVDEVVHICGGDIMKTDLQLQQEVLEELEFEPSIRELEIGVAAKDGVVTLTGFVDSYAEKKSAERAAGRINGVKAVADEIQVRLPGLYQRTDSDIAHAAVNALSWDIQVPDDRIKTTVENGWIYLDGEVEWQYQKWAAEDAVTNLMGVNGVTNVITVEQKRAPDAKRAAWQAPGVTKVDDLRFVAL